MNECKVDMNMRDSNGDTALHDAARFGHAQVANILLTEFGARWVRVKVGNSLSRDSSGRSGMGAIIECCSVSK